MSNAIPRPWWWFDFLTTPKLEFASLSSTGGTVGDLLDAAMDPTVTFEDLDAIRRIWPGKLAVKGVQNLEDARKLADLGVDGIVLSNQDPGRTDRADYETAGRTVGGGTDPEARHQLSRLHARVPVGSAFGARPERRP